MSETINGRKFCFNCGAEIDFKAEICPKCGVRQLGMSSGQKRSRIGAVLFAFFLGGLGFHKFYLGRVGMGIFYLLFCWTLLPSIAGFIEAIIYLTMSDADFNEKYSR